MAAVDTGKSFANGEQLTAAKLNQMFGNSTFASGAVDNSTMTVNSLGQLAVNQVTSSNIATNALNLDDIQQIATLKVLGRTSSGTGNVEQIDIVGANGILLDEDNFGSNANTRGASQQSIKNYVDTNIANFPVTTPTGTTMSTSGTVTLPGGLIMKFGSSESTIDGNETFTFPSAFSNNCFGVFITRTRSGTADILPVTAKSTSSFTINRINTIEGNESFDFLAIGN